MVVQLQNKFGGAQHSQGFRHRPEIDGLRALAVLPVIFFHAGFKTFSGGFVGVDVFFVISGYLITSLILSQKEAGTFRLVDFYERRARRILPALFLVVCSTVPFAWLWLRPSDLRAFGNSVTAVFLFASNMLFWRESGYFDTASELKPLLHTWSLSVEEQYYLAFPLFVILLWKFSRRWLLPALIGLTLTSLALAQWGSLHTPSAAFYLLPHARVGNPAWCGDRVLPALHGPSCAWPDAAPTNRRDRRPVPHRLCGIRL